MNVHPLILDNVRMLEQGEALAASLDDQGWADPSATGTSVGAHYRHVLDHYLALLRGVDGGAVDYEARERDRRVETDRHWAAQVSREVRERLQGLDPAATVSVCLRAGCEAEVDVGPARSSVARELVFVMLHAVHHYALVAIELRLRGRDPGAELGVAPATLGHRRRLGLR